MSLTNRNLNKEVSIEYPLYQSQKGNYFIGQTPTLKCINNQAIIALTNPTNSAVNIFLNAITITNTSQQNLSAEVYLQSTIPKGNISPLFSCTNLAFISIPQPYGEIKYNDTINTPPIDGVPIFSRIISPSSTVVIDGGQIIIPPKSCILVFLGGYLPVISDNTIVAFGWWEEIINKYCFNTCSNYI